MKKSLFVFSIIAIALASCDSNTAQVFNVTWNVDGDSFRETYRLGETPKYKFGLSKPSDKTYSYTFSSWDKPIVPVNQDETYTAVYSKEYIEYAITWNVDGDVFTEIYHYGDTPSLENYGNEAFLYSDLKYYPDIKPVDGNASYLATSFKKDLRTYDICFVIDDETIVVPFYYGQEPKCPAVPSKEGTAEYSFDFIGWDKPLTKVTDNASYTAIFEKKKNRYNIVFDLGEEKIIEEYEFGQMPTFKGTPSRKGNAKYEFSFKGWDKPFQNVVGDEIYTALFDSQIKTYQIDFFEPGSPSPFLTQIMGFDEVIDKKIVQNPDENEREIAGFTYNETFYTSLHVNGNMSLEISYQDSAEIIVNRRLYNGTLIGEPKVYKALVGSVRHIDNDAICNRFYPNQDYIETLVDGDKSIDIYYSEIDVYDGHSIAPYFYMGTGSSADPYRITSGAELALFKSMVNDNGGKKVDCNFKMMKSIDLKAAPNFVIGQQIESPTYYFSGTFDGNNCSIRGLNIEGEQCPALFSATGYGSVIKNLSVYGSIKGTHFTSAIVGRSHGDLINLNNYANVVAEGANGCGGIAAETTKSKVQNCSNYGRIEMVSNHEKIGGIIGTIITSGTLNECHNFGQIIGYKYVGGLVGHGYVTSSTTTNFYGIESSYNVSDVTGYQNVGGILGGAPATAVFAFDSLENYGDIYAKSNKIGGIFGSGATNKFANCTNYGNVVAEAKGDSYAGGLAGQLLNYQNDGASNLVNFGNVAGNQRVGGIVGNLHQDLFDSTNYGSVSSNKKISSSWMGGICGVIGGTVTLKNCVNNGNVHNSNNYAGGISGSTANTEGIVICIDSCVNNGFVTAEGNSAGGILGTNNSGKTDLTVKSCVNNGTIVGGNFVGGIVGNSLVPAWRYILEGQEACISNGQIVCIGNQSGKFIGRQA